MDFSKQENINRRLTRGGYNEKIYEKVLLWILRIACIGVLAVICVGVGVGFGTFLGLLDGAPQVDLDSLAIDRQTSAIYYLKTGQKITDIYTAEQRTSVSIEEVPQALQDAVVAIEDRHFYSHSGIDLEGIIRAGVANIRSGGTAEGGSTITQQMIKKMVLTSDQNWKRKMQEWYLALQLEDQMYEVYGKEHTKELILESYLNYNYLGNACYGVEAASQRYFGKHVSDLTLSESALIAGLFNAPSAYDPIANYKGHSRERQLQVLDAMLDMEFITQEEYDEARADNVFQRIRDYNKEYEASDDDVYSYFVDSTIEAVMKDLQEELGYSERDAHNTLYYGGLKIYITQDPDVQAAIDAAYADPENFQSNTYYEMRYDLTLFDEKDPNITDNYGTYGLFYSEDDARLAAEEFKAQFVTEDMEKNVHYMENLTLTIEPQYSMTVIDQHTGYVVGLAGGRGEKTQNLTLNRAIDSTRQPGSTFKILASYAAALDVGGFGCGSSMDDAPLQWGDWAPNNYYGGYHGKDTMRKGIYNSENIVTARFMRAVGVETNFDYVEKFGITTLRREADENGYTDMVGSLCLGSGSVKNIELCGAYACIANGGMYIEPILYARIDDAEGNLFYENVPETHRVIKESTAWMLTDMLRDVVQSYGTSPICNFDYEMAIAGKSGTTDDANDYAFVGYTPYYTCCVQAGFDYIAYPEIYYESLGTTSLNPDASWNYYDGYGREWMYYNAHKELWADVMSRIHEGLEKIPDFGEPPADVTQVAYCMDCGKLAGAYCSMDQRGSRVTYDYCSVENIPTEVCSCHIQLTVCAETHRIATKYCPATETAVFLTRTPEEIADVGAGNLALLPDFNVCAYPASLGLSYKSEESFDTPFVDDIASYSPTYCNECQLHLHKPKEESSEIAPLESSGAPTEAAPTATPNDSQPDAGLAYTISSNNLSKKGTKKHGRSQI
ncbi:MAG: transglycosylase domain-containing protein [Firmicutes bacterium]|nr:transglycosylase domain-containing protein [Bacillota bacterium]